MDNPLFLDMAAKMRRASESMAAAHTRMVEANGEIATAMHAYGEWLDTLIATDEKHEDLRTRLVRLEQSIMEIGRGLTTLREERKQLNGGEA